MYLPAFTYKLRTSMCIPYVRNMQKFSEDLYFAEGKSERIFTVSILLIIRLDTGLQRRTQQAYREICEFRVYGIHYKMHG